MNTASTGRPVVVVLPSAQRRGAEIQGAELASELRIRGWDARAVAIAPGAGTSALDVPVLGGTRWSMRGLMALRRAAKDSLLVAHGSSALLAVGLATIGTRSRWVYRSIGDPNAWVSGRVQRLRTGFLLRRADAVVVCGRVRRRPWFPRTAYREDESSRSRTTGIRTGSPRSVPRSERQRDGVSVSVGL
jgi:hypothetical protein